MRGWRLVAVGCVLGAAAAVLVATLRMIRSEEPEPEPAGNAQGEVFSAAAGDPLDLIVGPDGCIVVLGSYYPSSADCIDLATVDDIGSWQLVVPLVKRKPPVVVGALPAGASGANVQVGSTRVEASTRGRWFIASLPRGSLGPRNQAPVEVSFTG